MRNARRHAQNIERLQRLTPAATARWEKLWIWITTLLPRLSDQFQVALGEIVCMRHDPLLTWSLMRWLVVDTPVQAPQGKVETSPEMPTIRPGKWEGELAAL